MLKAIAASPGARDDSHHQAVVVVEPTDAPDAPVITIATVASDRSGNIVLVAAPAAHTGGGRHGRLIMSA
jgi:hypothetical protein